MHFSRIVKAFQRVSNACKDFSRALGGLQEGIPKAMQRPPQALDFLGGPGASKPSGLDEGSKEAQGSLGCLETFSEVLA
jgi:hypothetical protein